MNLRLLDVFLPKSQVQNVLLLLQDYPVIGNWQVELNSDQQLLKILITGHEAETVIDQLESKFSGIDGFRVVLLAVEASIPHANSLLTTDSPPPEQDFDPRSTRINRQELYTAIASTVNTIGTHVLLVFLSTIIAAIGLLRNDGTILIGAMVIAPLLGPNMALALAATLGDVPLAMRAVRIGAIGISFAFSLSVVIGVLFPIHPDIAEIISRTRVDGSDIVLAIASGMAGALSFTYSATSAIVGVMVAVALLPPLVTFGMLIGSGHWQPALGALLLVLTNLICLNLAGVVTFAIQNIRPGQWWEEHKAKQIRFTAVWFWLTLLSLAIAGILVWQRGHQI